MAKKPFQIQLEAKAADDLTNLAGAAGMGRPEYVRAVLTVFSRLKRERALDALASIPKDYFKANPGRPNGPSDET